MAKKASKKTGRGSEKKTLRVAAHAGEVQKPWLWLAGILIIGFLVYTPILSAEFLHYDDDLYIRFNPLIQTLSMANIIELFTTFVGNQYSPVAMTIMAIEVAIFGMNAAPLKFISILLHLGNGVAVYYFIRILLKRQDLALILAGIFTLHAMNTESVAWLTASMKIGTFSLFQLLSLISYTLYIDGKQRKHLYGSMVWFVLSGLCKEQGVVLPALLLGIDYLRNRDLFSRELWLEKIPFFALALLISSATLMVADEQQGDNTVFPYSVFLTLIFATYSVSAYFTKLLLPVELSTFYFFPSVKNVPDWFYVTPLFVLALGYLAYWTWKKDRRIMVFGLWFFFVNVSLSMVAQILSVRPIIIANRYMYLPMIGFFILVVPLLMQFFDKRRISRRLQYGMFGIYGIVLAFLTYQRAEVWKSDFTAMTDAVEQSTRWGRDDAPLLAFVFNNLGVAHREMGDNEEAERLYRKALECHPRYEQSYANLGNLQMMTGRLAEAEANYDKALSINEENAKAHSGRGAVYAQTGRTQEALQEFARAIELDAELKDAYSNRFLTYHQLGRYEEALADARQLIRIDPADPSAHHDMGSTLALLGKRQEALAAYSEAIRLDSGNGRYFFSRARIRQALGDRPGALSDALQAQSLGYPVDPEFLNGLR